MTVTVYGQAYTCSSAVKGPDYVNLYDDAGQCIAAFGGISNFEGYEIEGGEWSEPPKPELDVLREEITQLKADRDALIIAALEGGAHAQ